jgi:hypothetical protein
VRISSESVSAFGQPSETKPIFGASLAVRFGSSAASVIRAFSPIA